MLHPDQIRVQKGFNVRVDMGDMKGLKGSIEYNGIKTPIKVIKTTDKVAKGSAVAGEPIYDLVDGHRRTQIAQQLTAKYEDGSYIEVPALELEKDTSKQDMTLEMLVTGEGQQQLNMYEQGLAMKRLLDGDEETEGYSVSDIARAIGKSPTHVDNCLLLLKAPKSTLDQIKAGTLSATAAVELLKHNAPEEIEEHVAKAAAKKGAGKKVTVKDVEEAAEKPLTAKGKSKSASGTTDKKGATGTPSSAGGKNGSAIDELVTLREALKAQTDMEQIPASFKVLNGIIDVLKGKKEPFEITELFLVEKAGGAKKPVKAKSAPVEEEDELEEAKPAKKSLKDALFGKGEKEEEAPKKKATAPAKKAAATPSKTTSKKAATKKVEDEDFEDDEDLEETKPAKKTAAKKVAKPEPEEEDDDDFDLDEEALDEDLDDELEDDDDIV